MSRYNIGEAVVSVSLEKICNVFAHIASFKLIHVNRIFLQQFLDCLLLASRKRVWTEKLLRVKQYTATDRPQSNVWQCETRVFAVRHVHANESRSNLLRSQISTQRLRLLVVK